MWQRNPIAQTSPNGNYQYLYYTDGVDIFRKGVLLDEFVTEQYQYDNYPIPVGVDMPQYRYFVEGETKYRDGVRDGSFVHDIALTELGFDGVESTDEGVTGDWWCKQSF